MSGSVAGPVTLAFSLSGSAAVAIQQPVIGDVFTVVFPPAAMRSSITQLSSTCGALNSYKVCVNPTQGTSANAAITVAGFNSPDADGNIFVDSDGSFSSLASLQTTPVTVNDAASTTRSVVLTAVRALNAGVPACFSISMGNPTVSVAAQALNVTLSFVDPTFSVIGEIVEGGLVLAAPCDNTPNTFSTATVTESSQINGALNTLTFTLKCAKNLPKSSKIVFSGIRNPTDSPTDSLAVAGVDGASVTAVYSVAVDSVTGLNTYTITMTVTSDQGIPTAIRPAVFAVTFTNPTSAKTAVTLSATVIGPVPIPATSMTAAVLGAGQVSASFWSTFTVQQSSVTLLDTNTLIFVASPSVALSIGDSVCVTGLDHFDIPPGGTITLDNTVPASNAATFFVASKVTYSFGTLCLPVAASIQPSDTVTFGFSVTNPSSVQTVAPPIFLLAKGFNVIPATPAPLGSLLPITLQVFHLFSICCPPCPLFLLFLTVQARQAFVKVEAVASSLVAGTTNVLTFCIMPLRTLYEMPSFIFDFFFFRHQRCWLFYCDHESGGDLDSGRYNCDLHLEKWWDAHHPRRHYVPAW